MSSFLRTSARASLALTGALLAGPVPSAHAQAQAAPQPVRAAPPMSAVNCDALNKYTLVCVRNATPDAIVKIACSGFWGSSDLSLPNGIIRAGETTIVDFDKSKCAKHIVVFTRGGHQYPYDGFDTTSNTTLLVEAN